MGVDYGLSADRRLLTERDGREGDSIDCRGGGLCFPRGLGANHSWLQAKMAALRVSDRKEGASTYGETLPSDKRHEYERRCKCDMRRVVSISGAFSRELDSLGPRWWILITRSLADAGVMLTFTSSGLCYFVMLGFVFGDLDKFMAPLGPEVDRIPPPPPPTSNTNQNNMDFQNPLQAMIDQSSSATNPQWSATPQFAQGVLALTRWIEKWNQ
ncbi:hypothetical protein Tco_0570236 [Tanacetum coccineum]